MAVGTNSIGMKPLSWISLPPTSPGQRIGLLGGSFDPAHAGHRHISLEALARLELDQVWWLVSPGNPLKNHDRLGALNQRITDAKAVAHHPRIKVTGFEAELGTSFTAETLDFLCGRVRGVHFVWLMGADNLASFDRWRAWRGIMQLMPVAVFDRPGWRYRALGSRAASAFAAVRVPASESRRLPRFAAPAWTFLSIRLSDLSSTALRSPRDEVGLARQFTPHHIQPAG